MDIRFANRVHRFPWFPVGILNSTTTSMHKYFLGVALAIVAISCTNSNSDNDAIVQQYFTHFNNHNWAAMADMYADTALFKDPSLGKGIVKQTKAQTITKYSQLQQAVPDIKDSVVQMYQAGQHITVEFISTGTAPDGNRFTLPICTIFCIERGKITQDFTYYDNE
jgi:steroid delta-isomerase-like uncharacterized protein